MGGLAESSVEAFLGLMIVVAVVAAAVRFVRLPYTVALVLTGLALAVVPNAPSFQLTPGVILTVFLPVLLFYGAYNLSAEDLRKTLVPVTLLAVPGVVATAGLVGVVLHLTTSLTWTEAFVFGTIVSATDPVAVLAIFGELGAPRRLTTLVAGESLLNDGTALVFFTTMLALALSSTVDLGSTAEHFVVDLAGSLALGVVVGIVGSALLRPVDDALLETTMTLIIAYGGYLLAARLGISGPLETVAAGLYLGVRGMHVMSSTTRVQAGATWEFLDFLANSLLFLLMGLALRPIGEMTATRLGAGFWWSMAAAIVAVTVSRVVVVGVVHSVLARIRRPLPHGWATVLTWAGLRGAVSFAAALSLPSDLPQRDLLLTLTFGVVLFTLLAQGLTVGTVVERLGIGSEEGTRHDLELRLGRLRMLDAAIQEVNALRRSDGMEDHLAVRLLQEYAEQRRAIRVRADEGFDREERPDREQEQQVKYRLLDVQHEAARAALERGQLSPAVYRELGADLERQRAALEGAEEEP